MRRALEHGTSAAALLLGCSGSRCKGARQLWLRRGDLADELGIVDKTAATSCCCPTRSPRSSAGFLDAPAARRSGELV